MSNAVIISIPGKKVLFSYGTPVAFLNHQEQALDWNVYQTETKYSKTTTKHINMFFDWVIEQKFLSAFNPVKISQEKLNFLIGDMSVLAL